MNEYDWGNYGGLEKFDSFPIHDVIAVWLTNEYALFGKNILDVGGGTGIQLSYGKYFIEEKKYEGKISVAIFFSGKELICGRHKKQYIFRV